MGQSDVITVSRYANDPLDVWRLIHVPARTSIKRPTEVVFEIPGVFVSQPVSMTKSGSFSTQLTAAEQRAIALAIAVNPDLAHWVIRLKNAQSSFSMEFQHGLPEDSPQDPNGGSFVQDPSLELHYGRLRTDVTQATHRSPYPLLTTMACGGGCGCAA